MRVVVTMARLSLPMIRQAFDVSRMHGARLRSSERTGGCALGRSSMCVNTPTLRICDVAVP